MEQKLSDIVKGKKIFNTMGQSYTVKKVNIWDPLHLPEIQGYKWIECEDNVLLLAPTDAITCPFKDGVIVHSSDVKIVLVHPFYDDEKKYKSKFWN